MAADMTICKDFFLLKKNKRTKNYQGEVKRNITPDNNSCNLEEVSTSKNKNKSETYQYIPMQNLVIERHQIHRSN